MVRGTEVKTNFSDVKVQVSTDGKISIFGLKPFRDMDVAIPTAIWKMYQNYRDGDKVVRSGHGLCGVYDFCPDAPLDFDYIENDTMHSTTAEEVAKNIFRFYPGLFNDKDKARIIDFLRYHDLGEDKEGDKPDDGSNSREAKVALELNEFILKVQYLPPHIQEQLISDFIIFEDAGNILWSKEDRLVMQFAKLCDKTDAPLAALLFESQGRGGDLMHKERHFGFITEQDKRYANEMRESSQAAVWTAHMLDTYRDYKNLELFASIIVAACKDVRGFVFPGLYEFLKKNDIFDESTRLRLTD